MKSPALPGGHSASCQMTIINSLIADYQYREHVFLPHTTFSALPRTSLLPD